MGSTAPGSDSNAAQPNEGAAFLQQLPLFAGLSEEERRIVASHASRKTYRKNTIVMEKGDESTSLYVLLSGRVKVFVADEEGKELVLNILEPGAHFGELSLLGASGRTASVMTQEDCLFMIISKGDFLTCLNNNPQINLSLMRHLIEQIQVLTERTAALGLQDVYGRVASVLQELAREENGRYITGRLTQQDIGQMVGASREMISRILKELKQGEYIEIENKRIILKRPLPQRW